MTESTTEINCTLRPMSCELNHLSMPDGSSMLMQGDTMIVAGVYGPVEAKAQKMLYNKASIDVVYSPVKGPAKVDDRTIELYLKEIYEATIIAGLHPGSAICINAQEVQDSGGLLACAINAVCLALINSGLSMKFTIAAVSCMIEDETNRIILDPDKAQLENAKATFVYAFDSIKKDVVCCYTTGHFSEEEFLETMDKCVQASQHIFDFYRNLVKNFANVI